MSATQLYRNLKPEYQARVDEVQEKPYYLHRWAMGDDGEYSTDEIIARSKTVAGIKSFFRLHKLSEDKECNYAIYREYIVEFVEDWYPAYDHELVEEL